MAKPSMPRKLKASDYMIYSALLAVFEGFCTMVGAAMDCTVNMDGKPDLSQISIGMERVINDPGLIMMTLSNTNSYAVKCVLFGTFGAGLYALYKYSEGKKRLHRQGVEHGSAKWADKKEIKALADKTHTKEFLPLRSPDGHYVFDAHGNFVGAMTDRNLLLAKDVYLALDAKQHLLNLNVLIIGGSGSGKTRFFAKPNIMQLNTSYVITDPKGEILQSTGKLLTEAGYQVRVLNLIEMEHSNNYNPFHYVYDHNGNLSEDNIKKMVHVLYSATKGDGEKDDFWAQKGQTMLEAIVFLLFEESEYSAEFDQNNRIIESTRDRTNLNFFAVTEKMRKLQYPPRGSQKPDGFFLEQAENEDAETFRKRQNEAFLCPLDRDFIELHRRKADSLAYRLYCEVRNAPEETGQSFLSSANVKTFMFNLTNLSNLTCCDNIELEKLGDRKTALFLIISATDSTYNFVASMLYTQMFDVLSNRANFKYGGKLPVHVRCIMDEFANLPQIPDFEKVIAFVRSMGMSLNVIVQNLAQLKAKYEKTWEVITGNCDSLLFLGGKEESTLKYLSEALGKETIDVRGHNKTKGKQPSTSENNSIMGRELMQQNEIASMPITDCLLLMRSHNPFYCMKFPIEKHPNYIYLADYDENNAFDVHTIHSVTVEEFMQSQKIATNGNFVRETENGFEAPECYAEEIRRIEKLYRPKKSGYRAKLRNDIDLFLMQSQSIEELLEKLQKAGYEIKNGKYIAAKPKEAVNFIRLKSLGEHYSEYGLKNRIQAKQKYEQQIENQIRAESDKDTPQCMVLQTIRFYTVTFSKNVLPMRKQNQKKPFSWTNDAEIDRLLSLNKMTNEGASPESLRRNFEEQERRVSEWETAVRKSEHDLKEILDLKEKIEIVYAGKQSAACTYDQARTALQEYPNITRENYRNIDKLVASETEKLHQAQAALQEENNKLKEASELVTAMERVMGGTYVQYLLSGERLRRESDFIPNGSRQVGS